MASSGGLQFPNLLPSSFFGDSCEAISKGRRLQSASTRFTGAYYYLNSIGSCGEQLFLSSVLIQIVLCGIIVLLHKVRLKDEWPSHSCCTCSPSLTRLHSQIARTAVAHRSLKTKVDAGKLKKIPSSLCSPSLRYLAAAMYEPMVTACLIGIFTSSSPLPRGSQ